MILFTFNRKFLNHIYVIGNLVNYRGKKEITQASGLLERYEKIEQLCLSSTNQLSRNREILCKRFIYLKVTVQLLIQRNSHVSHVLLFSMMRKEIHI